MGICSLSRAQGRYSIAKNRGDCSVFIGRPYVIMKQCRVMRIGMDSFPKNTVRVVC